MKPTELPQTFTVDPREALLRRARDTAEELWAYAREHRHSLESARHASHIHTRIRLMIEWAQDEIDRVSAMKAKVAAKYTAANKEAAELRKKIRQLQAELDAAKPKQPAVAETLSTAGLDATPEIG